MAYSGEGSLLEAVILNDPTGKVIPVVCDSSGRLVINLAGTTVTIGTIEIRDSNGNPIDTTNGSIDVNVTNFPFSLDSDGSLLVTLDKSSNTNNVSLVNVQASLSPVLLVGSDINRKFLTIYNNSTSDLLIRFGTQPDNTTFNLRVPRKGYYESPAPVFAGNIYGMWENTAIGNALISSYF